MLGSLLRVFQLCGDVICPRRNPIHAVFASVVRSCAEALQQPIGSVFVIHSPQQLNLDAFERVSAFIGEPAADTPRPSHANKEISVLRIGNGAVPDVSTARERKIVGTRRDVLKNKSAVAVREDKSLIERDLDSGYRASRL
jgi:hypothetical protein